MKLKNNFYNIQDKVLSFYTDLPFNIYDNINIGALKVKENNALVAYPVLKNILNDKEIKTILDVGSGGGWFVNSLSSIYPEKVIEGIDFNQVAVEYSNSIKKELKLNCTFRKENLFDLDESKKYDFISSIGVLHHTPDCHLAIKQVIKLMHKNCYFFLGLYHKYGRTPFLEYFRKMENLNDEEKFEKFKELRNLKDQKHSYSWFRDQVLHPHESLHTFEEISKLLNDCKLKIISTSINRFEENFEFNEIVSLEKKLEQISISKLKEKKYYPGFFIILAQKC